MLPHVHLPRSTKSMAIRFTSPRVSSSWLTTRPVSVFNLRPRLPNLLILIARGLDLVSVSWQDLHLFMPSARFRPHPHSPIERFALALSTLVAVFFLAHDTQCLLFSRDLLPHPTQSPLSTRFLYVDFPTTASSRLFHEIIRRILRRGLHHRAGGVHFGNGEVLVPLSFASLDSNSYFSRK